MNKIEAIKASVSIFDILDFYKISYLGEATHQIICPFHEEQHPSARVYEDSQGVYCWVCSKFWDVLDFVREKEQISLPETLRFIEERFTIKPYRKDYKDKISILLKKHKQQFSLTEEGRSKLRDVVADELIESSFYRKVQNVDVLRDLWAMLDEGYRDWSYEEYKDWLAYAKGVVQQEAVVEVKVEEFVREHKLNVGDARRDDEFEC